MAAPKTVLTYPLNGALKDFPIPFEYLARKFVAITLIGKTRRTLVLNSEYRFTTKTTITTTAAWGPAQGYDSIEVRRVTSATERLVDFSDGSILRAYDLNTAQVQSLHIAEEARDLTADTIGVNNNGDLDARGRKIVNVADGVADGDAVNLRQQKAWAGSALNQALASAESARQAATSAIQSQQSATSSQNSATASANSATASEASNKASRTNNEQSYQNLVAAQQQATNSANSANASESSRKAAAASQEAAAGSASTATAQADRAKTEADKLGNINSFAGTIESINASNGVQFKADVAARGNFTVRSDGDANLNFTTSTGAGNVRWTRNGARQMLLVDDLAGKVRAAFQVDGSFDTPSDIRAQGSLYAKTGTVGVTASSPTANTHTWHYHADGSNRGILYMDNASNYHIQLAGREHAVFYAAGNTGYNGHITAPSAGFGGRITANDIVVVGNVYSGNGGAYLQTDGNIYGGTWGGWLSNWINSNFISLGNFRARSAEYFSANQIGSYCFLQNVSGTNVGQNGVVGGAQLRLSSHNNVANASPEGSWRQLGWCNNAGVSVWIRIA